MWLFLCVCVTFIGIAFLGTAGNLLCIVAMVSKFDFVDDENAGMLLIASTCAAGLGLCISYKWGAIGSLFGEEWIPGIAPNVIGISSSFLWCVYTWKIIALSLNRFVAVLLPFQYSSIFSARRSKILIVFIWFVCAVHSIQIVWLCCSDRWYVENVMTWYAIEPNETNWMANIDMVMYTAPSMVLPLILYIGITIKLALNKGVGIDVNLCWHYFVLIVANWLSNMAWTVVPLFSENPSWYYLTAIFTVANYAIDPFIHIGFSSKVREAVEGTLRSILKIFKHDPNSNQVVPINQPRAA